ncbi:phosphoglycolate phosphatase [Rhodobaculum claviforme]|uniref:Phosphoglycolate phosphatase n=1 Tax=Rhodobaculum claviforme TaxID=1549854 RepID=A0A934TH25_9RHOB|nr:phosphoglycolate phosphatase [Rhodobaculum claviforme]MBK5926224.1 phosphoglycolate phosphatase [Rhodobaculum claviforme]
MRTVIFDLDGTLIDSAPDIRAAANTVLAQDGLAPLSLAETRSFIGAGAATFVERMAAARLPCPDPVRTARMLDAFIALYEGAVGLTRPYPGAVAALEGLARDGWALGLCTNKPVAPTRSVLAHLDLARFFAVIVGGDSLAVRKPDPAPLRHAMAALNTDRCVYVGDSETDAATAQAAAVPFALYTEGYRLTPPEELPHDFAFAEFTALTDWLAARPAG